MDLKGKLVIAGPYDKGTIADITSRFSQMLGREVSLTVKRDDSLIGGFVVAIDGKLYDSSIRTRVENMQHHLFTSR